MLKIIRNTFVLAANRLYLTQQSRRCKKWFADNGDSTLRLNYDLDENSIVFDLGGYKGQWASDIFSKYCCNVYVFEPVLDYYDEIEKRFLKNKKVRIFPFGMANRDCEMTIGIENDKSSLYKKGGKSETIQLKGFKEFCNDQQIKRIDLIKINIEGAEYDLLDHAISEGCIESIENIQVQFHDFVENAETRMKNINNKLIQTHRLTWQYPFVWENWKLKQQKV